MTDTAESQLAKLRGQVERALERSDAASSSLAISLLNRMLAIAIDASDDALYAHRHLAELLLEREPWRAALHVRRVLVHDDADDALHAMMGLCQALLGNYRAAVASYGRAARVAPSIGWYHHNLGHLLDVALDEPKRAEPHLRTAYRLANHHDEVVASLAHCLARIEQRAEALDLAKRARSLKPNKPAHRDLFDWISSGGTAPVSAGDGSGPGESGRAGRDAGATRGRSRSTRSLAGRAADGRAEANRAEAARKVDGARDRNRGRRLETTALTDYPSADIREIEVADAFDAQMGLSGYSTPMIEGAHRLWEDFARGRTLRTVKTSVYAAAVEYAMATLAAWPGVSQVSVARRYGVAATSVATRYGEIRDALGIRPFDPRYSSKT
jgi:tetratricopeptide (TPR) repeat protein